MPTTATTPRRAVSSLTDEALLLRWVREADADALAALIDRRWPGAYRFARRCLGDPAIAEDAAQEAFLGLLRAAPRFRPEARFDPWWATILINAVKKAGRGRTRRASMHERARAAEAARPRGGEPPPDQHAEVAEVADAIAELPIELRAPIVLHYYEGRTHAEVADELGCPVGTASSRIRRGVDRLRESLAGRRVAGAALPATLALLTKLDAPAVPAAPSAATLLGGAAGAAGGTGAALAGATELTGGVAGGVTAVSGGVTAAFGGIGGKLLGTLVAGAVVVGLTANAYLGAGTDDAVATRRTRRILSALDAALTEHFTATREFPPDGVDRIPGLEVTAAGVAVPKSDPDGLAPSPSGIEHRRGTSSLIYHLMRQTIRPASTGPGGGSTGARLLGPFLDASTLPPSCFSRLRPDGTPDLADPECELLDGWGRPLRYDRVRSVDAVSALSGSVDPRRDGATLRSRNVGAYDLWSEGRDPADPADDVGNW